MLHYMGDILLGSSKIHETKFEIVPKTLMEVYSTLKLIKYEFLKTKIEFLCHQLTSQGVMPRRNKTEAMHQQLDEIVPNKHFLNRHFESQFLQTSLTLIAQL
uniref:Reverse transcriptase domain-containing protein n=1 Tax=Glossina pallidipes TaxID=7398 RepID=A0A1A9ZUV4_GLOPL